MAEITAREAFDAEETTPYVDDLDATVEEQDGLEAAWPRVSGRRSPSLTICRQRRQRVR
jgi:hypothetical protein